MTDDERREFLVRFMEEIVLPALVSHVADSQRQSQQDKWDAIDLYALPVSVRAFNALMNDGRYRTLGEIKRATDAQLLRVKNFGKKSLREVRWVVEHPEGQGYYDDHGHLIDEPH